MASARQPAQAGARFCYERHRPEETTLYRVVQEELETFLAGASAQPPELCIVDYHLGHAGQGLTALALLRRAWPGQRLTLAMMTGDAHAAHMAQQAQPDLEVLIKPVAPDALTGWIDKKVNSPR